MASIQLIKNREGKNYVVLFESYRENGKSKTNAVKSFGRLDKLKENGHPSYEELRTMAKENKIDYKSKKTKVHVVLDLNEKISCSKNYGYKLLESIYNQLDISKVVDEYSKDYKYKYDLDEVIRLLTFQRVINPSSKFKAIESKNSLFYPPNISQNDMNRSLKHIANIVDDIQYLIHKSVSKTMTRDVTLIFYDVTNYYFCIDQNDQDVLDDEGNIISSGLRKKGYSKENRSSPIVQMGLFMDQNFIPIAYKLFDGNINDVSTYKEFIQKIKDKFKLKNIVIVADKAMSSKDNISKTIEYGNDYIFSTKIRGKVDKKLLKFALGKDEWKYNDQKDFAIKSTIEGDKKIVVTWSQKYANRQSKKRDGLIKYLSGLKNPNKYKTSIVKDVYKKYVKVSVEDKKTKEKQFLSPFIDIDYQRIDQEELLDGINVIITSKVDMKDEDIVSAYHGLYKIEDCFRVSKSVLESRPVFVWKKEHIQAHFLTCYIALVIVRMMEYKLDYKYSAKAIVEALRSMSACYRTKDYYQTDSNEQSVEILKLLGVDWTNKYQSVEKINALSRIK
jgi:transposase